MKKIKIGWMFKDTLYLHGERGNILALNEIFKLNSMETEVVNIDFDNCDEIDFMEFDILFVAPGDLSSIEVVSKKLGSKKDELNQYIDNNKLLIVTGNSIALFGNEIIRTDGYRYMGLGIIDVKTVEKKMVYGDDILFKEKLTDSEIIGNQIQVSDFIGGNVDFYGKMTYGYGNTGEDENEGFLKNNAIFTNTLGPMLAVNMEYTVKLINKALNLELKLVEDETLLEIDRISFDIKKKFILDKETNLRNIKEN